MNNKELKEFTETCMVIAIKKTKALTNITSDAIYVYFMMLLMLGVMFAACGAHGIMLGGLWIWCFLLVIFLFKTAMEYEDSK